MASWDDGPGVLVLPTGRRVRGRALSAAPPPGPAPDLAVHLLGHRPDPTPWSSTWIAWPDFRLPRDRAAALAILRDAHARAATERIEVACHGGRGRTGTALAVLAVLDGVPPDQAVAFVRAGYHPRAVETPWQRRFVRRLAIP